ncbi:iron-containing alcohol dehydrogenase [Paludibacterium yongneupense]|uniref:iron-containing alcohol dehydrogenase n=1 Tax=Paludibacterium yongneupense TaxID=400061 RepID=UPI00041EC2F2|nr:iron-containing alcohol dehydrogenase [Paludibacterium yongneupense]
MNNFSVYNPTRIHFGHGQIARLADEIPAGARVMLVSGGGSIRRNGVHAEVMAALAGREVIEFAGVEANPEYETLLVAVAEGRCNGVDWILGVGGGSVLDAAKFIAAAILLPTDIDPWLIVGNRTSLAAALPIACVLTLPATGSESNFTSVITRRGTKDKISFKNPLVFPRCCVMDPAVCRSLPPRQLGNGLVDAFVHTTEQYLTYANDSRLQDRLAEGILQTLIEVAPPLLADPGDMAAAANFMWAANQAMFGLVGAGRPQDWTAHAISHELTALFGIDHGQTLALILPSLLEYGLAAKRERLAQYGRRVWGLSGEDEAVARAAINRTRDFFEACGVATRLADYGVDDADAAARAVQAQLQRHGRLALGERQNLTPADCAAIVRGAA